MGRDGRPSLPLYRMGSALSLIIRFIWTDAGVNIRERYLPTLELEMRPFISLKVIDLLGIGASLALLLCFSCSSDDQGPPRNIGREEAIEEATKAIVPLVVQHGDQYVCVMMDTLLAKGTVIEEDAPATTGASRHGAGPPSSTTLTEDSYFFYLDRSPNTFYAHDVAYIVIGKSSNYKVIYAQWWPKINGKTYGPFMSGIPDRRYVVGSSGDLTRPGGNVLRFTPLNLASPDEGFIVVQGVMPGNALYEDAQLTYANMLGFFRAYTNWSPAVKDLALDGAAHLFTTVDNLADAGKKKITIAIIAHGDTDMIRLADSTVTADELANKLASRPDASFSVILCSSHSGSFVDNLRPVFNVLAVQTDCRGDQSARPDWDDADPLTDINPDDVGAEWISSLFVAADTIASDDAKWQTIVGSASARGVPPAFMLIRQASLGAIGVNPAFGLTQNLDFADRMGWSTPQGYVVWQ